MHVCVRVHVHVHVRVCVNACMHVCVCVLINSEESESSITNIFLIILNGTSWYYAIYMHVLIIMGILSATVWQVDTW